MSCRSAKACSPASSGLLIALIDDAEKLCPYNVSVTILRPNRRRNTLRPVQPADRRFGAFE